jgi:hypothetical protein
MPIEAEFAEIHWSDRVVDGHRRVDEVEVFDRRKPRRDRPELDNSLGACCGDWLDGTDPRSTPEGVFAGWLRSNGFVSDEARIAALSELGKIDACEWALAMAEALERWRESEHPDLDH